MKDFPIFPICEMFTSIQGEGSRAGYPAIFIRTSGCNLRCVFKNTICDTAYSSFKPEKGSILPIEAVEYCVQHREIEDIVITGGEPMMFRYGVIEMMNEIVRQRDGWATTFTIETNGTLPVVKDSDLEGDCKLLISCSPKLRTSIPALGDNTYLSDAEINLYNSRRLNWPVLHQMIANNDSIQFKFVYSDDESVEEIKDILRNINNGIEDDAYPRYDVYLMPEGVNEETLQKTREGAVKACIENNWKYTDRLHIIIWGTKRGV